MIAVTKTSLLALAFLQFHATFYILSNHHIFFSSTFLSSLILSFSTYFFLCHTFEV
ncbi:hypothetical protein HanPSC8_Chr07g0290521 [Helianthus annuus]|nr:hypothetical protein HanPSC8_Chr07g0290521 [Helianthus annuus]